jgi:3-oxoacyl-[acyl-carrier protein] reductase
MRLIAVTGAGSGLGRHIALRAMEDGYAVVGFSRSAPEDGLGFPIVVGDVADRRAVAAFYAGLRDEPLWGMVNAAGIACMNLLLTTPAQTVARVLDTNLLGTLNACAEGAKILLRRKAGRIVNFSSIARQLALAGESVYAASKAGVETFTRCLARELGGFGITVNAVSPGPIATGILRGLTKRQVDAAVQRQIVQRMAEPEDVWHLVSFLLDARSSMISGEVIGIGGA